MNERIPGLTSTGSKRPAALFGSASAPDLPHHLARSEGCRVWDASGREYLDWIMALGAVALGYGHPEVVAAASEAAARGVVGPLPPVLEEEVAELLARHLPGVERVRFLKTGAEAMAAAVRLARVHTGRERVLGCGYHGWLDWCHREEPGIPAATGALFGELPFNDAERSRDIIRVAGDSLAAVVFEPVILAPPDREWLTVLRDESQRVGAVLVADEIKTAGRLGLSGAAGQFGFQADLTVVAKAIANGFPLAAVGGSAAVMQSAERTWISSTLATESVALAAARATIEVFERESVAEHLDLIGRQLLHGLSELSARYPAVIQAVQGIPQMSACIWASEEIGSRVAAECARRRLLLKRTPYNFPSLAHRESDVTWTLEVLSDVVATIAEDSAC
ncbi:MAG TPA: aminotransferase class III-fold pyridoxal phosphate-dependent enzyme [Gemmatimonadales bacterium]|nr:aminotransferase class III-fold pyridoxal phosphate-dependent enzyme [Gemmatimonadales bacterium]